MLRFGLLTSAEIIERSTLPLAGVTSAKMSLHFRPVENSLADLRLGAHDSGTRCARCHALPQDCVGHEGHILLAAPFPHPLFRRDGARLAMLVCPQCRRARVRASEWAHGAVVERALRAPASALVERALRLRRCEHCGASLPRRVSISEDGVDFSVLYHTGENQRDVAPFAADAPLLGDVVEYEVEAAEAEADAEIAQFGRSCGLDVPYMRPAELARDDTPSVPVVQHVVRFLESQGEHFDAIFLLQPTNPLRRPEQIAGLAPSKPAADLALSGLAHDLNNVFQTLMEAATART